jgi:hypothetical protein
VGRKGGVVGSPLFGTTDSFSLGGPDFIGLGGPLIFLVWGRTSLGGPLVLLVWGVH